MQTHACKSPGPTDDRQDATDTVEGTVRTMALVFGGAMAVFMLWMAWANGG